MKIRASKGTADQFIAELNDRIDYLEGNITSSKSIKSSRYSSTEIDTIETNVLDTIGSRSNIRPAIAVDLGDGTTGIIIDDDNVGVFMQILDSGEIIDDGIDIENRIYESWNEVIESATNTSNISVKPGVCNEIEECDRIEECDKVDEVIESAITDQPYFNLLISAIEDGLADNGFDCEVKMDDANIIVKIGEEDFEYYQPIDEIIPSIDDVESDGSSIVDAAIVSYNQYNAKL